MPKPLTNDIVEKLEAPVSGNKIYYDAPDRSGAVVRGFGVRITPRTQKGAVTRTFILNYRRISDRAERRLTIGTYPEWSVKAAREQAQILRTRIAAGEDPLGDAQKARQAPTVSELCDDFEAVHLPKKRANTQRDYKAILKTYVRPKLGKIKVADLKYEEIERFHAGIAAKRRANLTLSVLHAMLALAVKWRWRPDNPAKGIERHPEAPRERYLEADETQRLMAAFAADRDQEAANIFRLLLLTGARRNEVQSARWEHFDLSKGTWTKPREATKTDKKHVVPLSAPALHLLAELAPQNEGFVFPSVSKTGHRIEIKAAWKRVCTRAGIKGLRIHDLRHSYASNLASAGFGLHIIGRLLGHSQPSTTHRYAHLFDDPLRQATERVGALLALRNDPAEVISLSGKKARQ